MAKLEEVDFLRVKLATKEIEVALLQRDNLSRELLAKYGLPGETTLNLGPDGTINRPEPPQEAAKLEAV